MVCAKLHNFCIDEREEMPRTRYEQDTRAGDVHEVLLNEDNRENLTSQERNLMRRGTGDRRRDITNYFQEAGIVRPPFASCNSKA